MTLENRYHDLSNSTSFESNKGQKSQKENLQNGINHAKPIKIESSCSLRTWISKLS